MAINNSKNCKEILTSEPFMELLGCGEENDNKIRNLEAQSRVYI